MMLTWFARDDTPVLLGPRVTLRAPRPSDYVAWRTLRRDSRDFLKPFEPRWSEADLSRRVYSSRIRRGREEARAGTDYTFFIFLRDRERGYLARLDEEKRRAEALLGNILPGAVIARLTFRWDRSDEAQ